MAGGSLRHQMLAEELAEWWEDLCLEQTGSRVVVVAVPPGWGRSEVLARFRAAAEDADGPVGVVVCPKGSGLGRAVQAAELRSSLREAVSAGGRLSQVAGLLDLDKAAGRVQLGLGLAGLFGSGMAAAASLLVASLAVT